MKKDDISLLLQRYLSARKENKEVYFDADEIDELLNSFEETDDFTYYDEVLALGLKLHPGNTDLQIKKCKLYLYNDEPDSALKLIEKISDKDNEDLDILRLECYCSSEQYDKVVEFTQQLITNDCEYLETVFEFIAPVLNDLEMFKEAKDYLKLGLSLFPDNIILKNELCYILETAGDIQQAVDVCNQLIDKNPYSHEYWFTLGRLYSMMPDYDKAIEAFDFALTCDDSDTELKILKAYCLFMNENYQKAIDVYAEITTEDDSLYRIKPLMAECYIKLEDYEKGFKLLEDLLTEEDDESNIPSTFINFIHCCIQTGREKEASIALLKAIKLYPYDLHILSLLAFNYIGENKENMVISSSKEIIGTLDALYKSTDDEYECLFMVGQYIYVNEGIGNVLKYFQDILLISPDSHYVHAFLALAYLIDGDIVNFHKHNELVSPKEIKKYINKLDIKPEDIGLNHLSAEKHNSTQLLVNDFLNNKDNNN